MCYFWIYNNDTITAAAAGALLYTTLSVCVKLYTWITVAPYKKLKNQLLSRSLRKTGVYSTVLITWSTAVGSAG